MNTCLFQVLVRLFSLLRSVVCLILLLRALRSLGRLLRSCSSAFLAVFCKPFVLSFRCLQKMSLFEPLQRSGPLQRSERDADMIFEDSDAHRSALVRAVLEELLVILSIIRKLLERRDQ